MGKSLNRTKPQVDDELLELRKPGTFEAWNRFAAVNDEFVPIHMDDAAGMAAGNPSAFGMGNLQWAYLHALIEQWLDGSGRLETLQCRFQAPHLRGEWLTWRGSVTAVDAGDVIQLSFEAQSDVGTTLASATARVVWGS